MDHIPRKKFTLWTITLVTICTIIFLGVKNIGAVAAAVKWALNILMPLAIGLAFALIMNVPMGYFEKLLKKVSGRPMSVLRRPLAFAISLVIILAILAGMVSLIIPEISEAITVVIQGAVKLINKLDSFTSEDLKQYHLNSLESIILSIDWDSIRDTVQTWLRDQSGNIFDTALSTITTITDVIYDIFIAFVFSVYILFSKEQLKSQAARLIRAWLPKGPGEWFIHAVSMGSENFRSFITGQTIEACILALLCMIGMFILGIPYAFMVGILVGITALIPVVGSFIGAGAGAFMILTVSPVKSLIFIVFLLVLQQIEGNFIYPKVMGKRVNLPGLWILAAVTVGGGLAGPIGMLLAVPFAATAYTLLREATERREEKLRARPAEYESEE